MSCKVMLIPNPEKTSEKEEREGPGTMGNSSLMRKKTVYEMSSVYYQGWAQLSQALVEERGTVSLSRQRS